VTSWLKLSCAIEGAVSPAIHINATANLVPISRAFAPLFQHARVFIPPWSLTLALSVNAG